MPLCLANADAAASTALVSAGPLEPNISVSGALVNLRADQADDPELPELQAETTSNMPPMAAAESNALLYFIVNPSFISGVPAVGQIYGN